MRTLVVHCHPDPESFNAALYRTACDAVRAGGHEVRGIDLYAERFDPVLSREERQAYLLNPRLIEQRVQPHVDALRWAEHLVFVYPSWFYGPPAMLKGWLERVWLPGVAFLPPPEKGKTAVPGLRHVRRLTVVTTGGAPWWWLKVIGDPGKRLFTRGLRALFARGCKVTWLQLHNMNNVTRAELEAFLARVARTLGDLR
ncbi:MAG TPA: NAD(P)H-dependent oxidoreductase [Ramlibacter sp.]|nr:NAD(P)H-dependent oxidoreductase [Ramlibacter sp.]